MFEKPIEEQPFIFDEEIQNLNKNIQDIKQATPYFNNFSGESYYQLQQIKRGENNNNHFSHNNNFNNHYNNQSINAANEIFNAQDQHQQSSYKPPLRSFQAIKNLVDLKKKNLQIPHQNPKRQNNIQKCMQKLQERGLDFENERKNIFIKSQYLRQNIEDSKRGCSSIFSVSMLGPKTIHEYLNKAQDYALYAQVFQTHRRVTPSISQKKKKNSQDKMMTEDDEQYNSNNNNNFLNQNNNNQIMQIEKNNEDRIAKSHTNNDMLRKKLVKNLILKQKKLYDSNMDLNEFNNFIPSNINNNSELNNIQSIANNMHTDTRYNNSNSNMKDITRSNYDQNPAISQKSKAMAQVVMEYLRNKKIYQVKKQEQQYQMQQDQQNGENQDQFNQDKQKFNITQFENNQLQQLFGQLSEIILHSNTTNQAHRVQTAQIFSLISQILIDFESKKQELGMNSKKFNSCENNYYQSFYNKFKNQQQQQIPSSNNQNNFDDSNFIGINVAFERQGLQFTHNAKSVVQKLTEFMLKNSAKILEDKYFVNVLNQGNNINPHSISYIIRQQFNQRGSDIPFQEFSGNCFLYRDINNQQPYKIWAYLFQLFRSNQLYLIQNFLNSIDTTKLQSLQFFKDFCIPIFLNNVKLNFEKRTQIVAQLSKGRNEMNDDSADPFKKQLFYLAAKWEKACDMFFLNDMDDYLWLQLKMCLEQAQISKKSLQNPTFIEDLANFEKYQELDDQGIDYYGDTDDYNQHNADISSDNNDINEDNNISNNNNSYSQINGYQQQPNNISNFEAEEENINIIALDEMQKCVQEMYEDIKMEHIYLHVLSLNFSNVFRIMNHTQNRKNYVDLDDLGHFIILCIESGFFKYGLFKGVQPSYEKGDMVRNTENNDLINHLHQFLILKYEKLGVLAGVMYSCMVIAREDKDQLAQQIAQFTVQADKIEEMYEIAFEQGDKYQDLLKIIDNKTEMKLILGKIVKLCIHKQIVRFSMIRYMIKNGDNEQLFTLSQMVLSNQVKVNFEKQGYSLSKHNQIIINPTIDPHMGEKIILLLSQTIISYDFYNQIVQHMVQYHQQSYMIVKFLFNLNMILSQTLPNEGKWKIFINLEGNLFTDQADNIIAMHNTMKQQDSLDVFFIFFITYGYFIQSFQAQLRSNIISKPNTSIYKDRYNEIGLHFQLVKQFFNRIRQQEQQQDSFNSINAHFYQTVENIFIGVKQDL